MTKESYNFGVDTEAKRLYTETSGMTAKRFRFNGRTNCIEYDNESILLDSYGEDIEELLNTQDKQIFLLKCLIQTITAESIDKNISHKRILEIKKDWYDKLCGDEE